MENFLNWKGKRLSNPADGVGAGVGGVAAAGAGDRYPLDFTERVQSFFPQCKIFSDTTLG